MNENDLYTAIVNEGEEYLEHYGVLGMKWGIRKDPKKAYSKGVNKLKSYEDKKVKKKKKLLSQKAKMEKSVSKFNKYDRKVQKLAVKIGKRKFGVLSGLRSTNKTLKLQLKKEKLEYKSAKRKAKMEKRIAQYANSKAYATRMNLKGEKTVKAMMKAFKDVPVSSINKSDYDYVQDYLKRRKDY